MPLSDYEKQKFKNLDAMTMYQWYNIQPDRPDRTEFIETLKKYHDTWHTLEIRGEFSSFRKVWHPGTIEWAKRFNKKL